jgi:alkylation response protein AidB-like acyl-CoA dehydrogenase
LGRVVARVVQIFGGMGDCKKSPIERCYRYVRIYRSYHSTSEIHRSLNAKAALKKGASAFDPFR